MITNNADISLALAVWLLHDEYDYIDDPTYISATSLMKPLRHIVLAPRVNRALMPQDVQQFIPRALGHSLHDSIEKAWIKGHARSLKLMGYPEDVIERIRINPTDEERRASNSIIPIYLEQRGYREIVVDGVRYTVGGKFDMVTDGIVQDAKSTSAFTWVYGGKDDDYRQQMSLYRWIDAARPMPWITEDFGRINFIFTDWQGSSARSNPKYPQKRVEYKDIPLLSLKETENWVIEKLRLVKKYKQAPESELPHCTSDELWLSEPVYKYYSDPTKTSGRSTRNFDNLADARKHLAEKAGKGTVITVPGEPKRCGYCEAYTICTQKDRFFST